MEPADWPIRMDNNKEPPIWAKISKVKSDETPMMYVNRKQRILMEQQLIHFRENELHFPLILDRLLLVVPSETEVGYHYGYLHFIDSYSNLIGLRFLLNPSHKS